VFDSSRERKEPFSFTLGRSKWHARNISVGH
jgi:FKBP-type peptidyl-prolyl cis-trans isomerase